jgi:hypothetical protein
MMAGMTEIGWDYVKLGGADGQPGWGTHAMLVLTGGAVMEIICTQTNIAIWQIQPNRLA